MKNLNSIINDLKSDTSGTSELDRDQQKSIFGGRYSTEAECKENCGYAINSWGYWGGGNGCVPSDSGPNPVWHCEES
ncbi:hypothetical protein MHTCC0001_00150 [Flavobacteriaceae bacterium MHTCC 0001]